MITLLLFGVTLSPTESFLTESCWVPHCDCSRSLVYCFGLNLTQFPTFNPTLNANGISSTQYFNDLSITINKNPQLTTIPGQVFEHLGSHVYGEIIMSLESNRISVIDDTAFAGIEDKVTDLNLKYNSLTHIPVAIGKLRKLRGLHITHNPIKSLRLDTRVLSSLSPSLNFLSLSMGEFSTFPTELKLLTNLTNLIMKEIPFQGIDRHALSGQSQTLEQLEIWDSNLNEFPKALCDLSNLQYDTIIQSNNMTTLGNFSEECSLMKVSRLHLWNNTITAIYDNDLSGFSNLDYLDLSRNPISFISNQAFKHNTKLTYIDLSLTNLHILPIAITALSNLNSVILSGTYKCSCGDMSGFKDWGQKFLVNNTYLVYGSFCQKPFNSSYIYIGIGEYILKELPHCS